MTRRRTNTLDRIIADDYITSTVGILAQRRKGKTYTANVIAEDLTAAGLPWVALDPTGAWWGLRSSADGTKAGLPVVILGGEHGDVPLERTGGRLVADLVVEEPGWYVLDLSLFESKEADRQFATDFAERLYRRKGQPGGHDPLHLFIDEADLFCPQQSPSGDKRMLGAFETLVRRGGIRGIGTTLISQRAAVINKNVLEMIDTLIALRTVGPNDRAAIDGYIRANGTDEERAELLGSLASLALGEAWLWQPGADPPIFERVQIRERTTFNSSATPKAGQSAVEPARMAAVDLDALKERMAATIEKAERDDPKWLRGHVATLEREVAKLRADRAELHDQLDRRPAETVEVPVLTAEQLDRAAEVAATIEGIFEEHKGLLSEAAAFLLLAHQVTNDQLDTIRGRHLVVVQPGGGSSGGTTHGTAGSSRTTSVRPASLRDAQRAPDGAGSAPPIKAGARRMVEILQTFHPTPLTRSQLSTLAVVSKGGTFSTYLGSIVAAGLAVTRGDLVELTPHGLGGITDATPMGCAEIVDLYRPRLKAGARRMLDLLVDAYPDSLSRDQLSEMAEVSKGGTFSTYLGSLTRVGLAEERHRGHVVAGSTLFLGER